MRALRIGLIGERNDQVVAHRAIPQALELAAATASLPLDITWIPTDTVRDRSDLLPYEALWCVPASPYTSMDGALTAIGYAREHAIPFMGTCGGFQHAVIEYARSVLGWADAEHAETSPDAAHAVIVPLSCALVEVHDNVHVSPGSRIAQSYGVTDLVEGYHCRYGLSESFRHALGNTAMKITAVDDANEVRGIELDDHPFFVATLFQHERAALRGVCPPLVSALLRAAMNQRIEKAA